MTTLRQEQRLSRDDWSRRSDVSSGVITRVELGRMPLRYEDARRLLPALSVGGWVDIFPVNPLWLAEGIGPIELNWPILLPASEQIGLKPGISFLSFVAENRALLADLAKDPPEAVLPEPWLQAYLYHWVSMRPKVRRLLTGTYLLECVFRFSAERLARKSGAAVRALKDYKLVLRAENKRLTEITTCGNQGTNAPESTLITGLDSLRKRLALATRRRGAKAHLAAFLHVPRPRVSEWISGARDPSGETTLRLLNWVERQGRQQPKSPGAASTAPEQQTQSRKSSHEKPKSNQ